MPRDRVYWVWADMLSRCRNPNHSAWGNYGGRGIRVCDSWTSYGEFVRDMGPRPNGLMLDRIDNDGPYSPENCRWSTRTEQNSNRRNCIYVEHGETRVTLREYCRRENLTYRPIVKRIQNLGWSVDDALNVPLGKRRAA